MANLIQSPEHALPAMCASQARIYLDHTVPALFGADLFASKLWTTVEDDHYYDVYQVTAADGSRTERFFFDVTPYFGRGSEWSYDSWLDLPDTSRTYPVWLFFSESELQGIAALGRPDSYSELCSVTVSFLSSTSEQSGMRIVSRSPDNARHLTIRAMRSLATPSIPFLHGYPFYRLFLFDQLVHMSQGYAVDTDPNAESCVPVPGHDCVQFTPLNPFDLANDFINFMFWGHEPLAFDVPAEAIAFTETARFAIRSGMFSARELRAALGASRIEGELKQRLRGAIGVDAPRVHMELVPDRVAH